VSSVAQVRPEAHGVERGFTRVYIWHWPVRLFHWAMFASVIVLSITGLYIGRPYLILAPRATTPFLMGWMRFLHFIAAGVLVGALMLRLYALFWGDRHERWGSLLPWGKEDWVGIWRMTKKYARFDWWSGPHYIGHDPLKQLSFTTFYIFLLFMVASGFAMYGEANPGGFWWSVATRWMMPLMGGNQMVRLLHHLGLWLFAAFVPLHVYLVLRSDVLYDRGAVSSMISGNKFKHEHLDYEDA
jgi:Ni/Fe-hydrogenase 1 B-type cytochrome subunit